MRTLTLLTKASIWGDKCVPVEILTAEDVNRIVEKRLRLLAADVNRLEQENRDLKNRIAELQQHKDWLWGEINLMKQLLTGKIEADYMSDYVKKRGRNVLRELDEAFQARQRLDKLPEDVRQVFAQVVQEVLTPKLEIFARQIEALEGVHERYQVASKPEERKSLFARGKKWLVKGN